MFQQLTIIGNLGADPEIRYTNTGTGVANFRVATSERWTGKDGQKQERTEWHRCVAWDKKCELVGKYLSKGSRVFIQGKLRTRDYETDGQKRYITEVIVDEIKFLSPKNGEGEGATATDDSDIPFDV